MADEISQDGILGEDTSLLIVEDDKPFLTRLARAMESRGFADDTTETVEEAVAKGQAQTIGGVPVVLRALLEKLVELALFHPGHQVLVGTGARR